MVLILSNPLPVFVKVVHVFAGQAKIDGITARNFSLARADHLEGRVLPDGSVQQAGGAQLLHLLNRQFDGAVSSNQGMFRPQANGVGSRWNGCGTRVLGGKSSMGRKFMRGLPIKPATNVFPGRL